jgi:hypothetical protein
MITREYAAHLLSMSLPPGTLVSLHTSAPGQDRMATEVRCDGYRAMPSGAWKIDGTVATNTERIEFPVVRDNATVTHVGFGDGSTVRLWAKLASPVRLVAQSRIQFEPGTLALGIG